MLKHLFFIAFISLVSLSCNSKSEGYVIKGKLSNADNKTIYLDKILVNKVETIDSVKMKDGNFQFTGKLNEPGIFILRITNNSFIYLISDTLDKIEINANAENLMATYTVKGSKESILLRELSIHNLESMKKVDSLRTILNKYETSPKLDSVKNALGLEFNKVVNEEKQFLLSFIGKNKCTFAAFMALYQQMGPQNFILNISSDFKYYEMIDSCLNLKYPTSPFISSLHSEVSQNRSRANAKNYNIGDYADDISLPDPNGNIVKLSSLKGKYVLLDFWAAWCKPCRGENPNLVLNYNKYHSKGFEIYGISLDKEKQSWVNAINADKLTWIHVSDLKYWNSAVAIQYKVEGIPANFLLDKEGKIIGKNLRGEELSIKLAEIFK